MKITKNILILSGILLMGNVPVSAQSSDTGAIFPGDTWRFQLTPYVWLTGMDAIIRPVRRGPTVHTNQSLSSILKDLDSAAFLIATARKDKWVIQTDLSYAFLSNSGTLPYGIPVSARIKQGSATVTAGYSFKPFTSSTIDVMAGARFWSINARVSTPATPVLASTTRFIDPLVALRWRQAWAPHWSTILYVDAGADFTWQAIATLNYDITDRWSVSGGYRHLAVDYDRQGKRLNLKQGGPLVGVSYRF